MSTVSKNVADAYPLSPIQQGMLFHDIVEPGAYLVQVTGSLEGPLDVTAFEAAWQRMVDRHPVLRSAFVWKTAPKPLQVVARQVRLPFQLEDWSALDEASQEQRHRRFLEEDRARGLDLSRAPLMRITLVRRGRERHDFVWTLHHLLLDGWSYPQVLEEALALYEAAVAGRPEPPLPERRPFRDYIAWLMRQDLGAAESFWRQELDGFTEATRLDLGAVTGSGHGVEVLALDEARSAAVLELARRLQLTPATLFEGAWGRLLAAYSGASTVVFGSIGSGRPAELPGVEGIIGMFVSTLPVRLDLDPHQGVAAWLAALQARRLEARRFEHTPLVEIQKWSAVPAGRPLFESCLSFQSYPLDEALAQRSGSLRCRDFDIAEEPGFPLMVVVSPGRRLELKVEYRRDRFDRAAVRRLLRHLRHLLVALVAEPDLTVEEWRPLAPAERHQLLVEWSRGDGREIEEQPVHRLIAERARSFPEALAVECDGATLSYAQLVGRARGLAAQLRARGVGAESVVGMCLERSLELPVALLGILEAGAVCLPMDPAHPAERLTYVLDDAGAVALVTHGEVLARHPELGQDGGRQVLRVEDLPSAPAEDGPAEDGPAPIPSLDALAYTVYTSGSTGRPKGVLISHRSLAAYGRSMVRHFRLRADDRILQFASPGFNVLIEEIVPTLLAGAAVVLHHQDLLLSLGQFQRILEDERITGVELPAAFWQEWVRDLDERGARPPRDLRFLLLGCERPQTAALEVWRRFAVRLVYVFGLTETTITSSIHALAAGAPVPEGEMPIGRPVAGARLYVLGPDLEPVPAGVVGQLFIGGAGVGRGYRGRPGMTAERFVPDLRSRRPGQRLYRTGDRARHRADGSFEFLGRLDHQLKIRGFRVEPGEVEAALEALPVLDRAVVVARPGPAGTPQLVAYAVPAPDATAPNTAELRQALAGSLPEYMVPSHFVILGELPLNANGKVDRAALPAVSAGRPELEHSFVAPRNPAEEQLAAVWRTVLGVERVGVEDNFFELGGDSILAIQITARANRAGIKVTTRQIFEHPTVAALAAAADGAVVVRAEQGPVTGPVTLTPVQRWFLEQPRANHDHFTLPVVLELPVPWRPEPLQRALDLLVEHHDALRTRFTEEDGAWRQQILPRAEVDLVLADFGGLPAAGRHRALASLGGALQAGLDLDAGRLLRGALVEVGEGEAQRLVLAAHHLVVDAVSWRVLLEDLVAAYDALAADRAPALPPKTTSFQTWARRLEAWARAGGAAAEIEHWTSEMASQPLPLPRDSEGAPREGSAETLLTRLGAEATGELLQHVPRAYRGRVREALLAALTRALASWTGSSRLRLELEGHGRAELWGDVDLSRTVGWFTTLYPVVLELPAQVQAEPGTQVMVEADAGRDLAAIKEQLRALPGAAEGHEGLGYGVLRYLAGDEELALRLAGQPPPEILFNYVGQITGQTAQSSAEQPGASSAPRLSQDDPGPAADPDEIRTHLLAINAGIRDGALEIAWTFSPEVHRRDTVEQLAAAYLAALGGLARHCRDAAPRWTPSDFPLLRGAGSSSSREAQILDQETLDRLLEGVDEVEDLYPLSPLQEGMLFHGLYEPGSGQYVAQVLCELGDLDPVRFGAAWQRTAERHPVLRTAFRWDGLERPLQLVRRHVEVPLTVLDWREVSGDERAPRLAQLLEEDRARGFDLDRAPLQRFLLLRLEDGLWQMVWTFHQSVFDGWSLPVLFRDFLDAYAGAARPETVSPPAPAPLYRDYIAWLRRQDPQRAEEFWRHALEGFSTVTPLPYDRVAEAGAPRHARRSLALSTAETKALQAFARRGQVTVNTLVQGAWGLLLAQYSGERDVVFGGTVSGRPAELQEVESMVGLFINTLPVRVQREPREGVLAWLRRLRDQQAEQREYEYSALARIQRWSEVDAGESLFDSFLVFQNYPMEPVLAQGTGELEVRAYRTDERPHFALSLVVHPVADLLFELIYDARRFDGVTIDRLLRHLRGWLEAMTADPFAPVGRLSPLSAAEGHQLRVEWAVPVPAAPAPPEGLSVGEHFRRWAERQPLQTAVVWGSERLSYGELAERSNRLAHHLVALGVVVDEPVALCVERSAAMIVALLGILQAGGAYVPVADDYPAERQDYMLRDSGAKVLITDRATQPRLPAFGGTTVVLDGGVLDGGVLDGEGDAAAIAARPATAPAVAVYSDHLAYLNYTSGSTGKPKPVGLTHRGVERLALRTNYADLGPGESLVQGASISFDAATYEIWGCLLAGATLVGLPREVTLSPPDLAVALAEHKVDNLFLTTALLHQVAREAPATFRGLKRVMFGGEAVEPVWIREILEQGPPEQLFHFYGPTENTTYSTWHPVRRVAPGASTVPIGRAVSHSTVYAVDPGGRPSPVGVAGELWVGGDGLARGYLRRPAATAEKFVPDPFGAPGGRLYRTGDLVRWNQQGALEFVGRFDNQVKLRGFRIELGEIEGALVEHPAVAGAVVLVREDVPGQRRLVGYAATAPGAEAPSVPELREHLAGRLPKFMVPAALVILDALPLTANGKLDRRALPAPDLDRADLGGELVAPRDRREAILAEIFAQVLRLDAVGVDDNFFELGGDSILSIQLVSRAKRAGLRLTPRHIFEHPTVAELAAAADLGEAVVAEQGLVEGSLPLTPIQRAFLAHDPETRNHFNMPLLLASRDGALDPALLEEALDAVVRHHDALRLRLAAEGDGWRLDHAPLARFELERFDLSGAVDPARALEEAAGEIQAGLDLEHGPVLRAAFFDLGAEGDRLLLIPHHLVVDGVSWRILLEDLQTAYRQLAAGATVELPAKTTSFRAWATRLETWAHGPEVVAEAEHWLAEAVRPVTPLALDHPEGPASVATTHTCTVELDREQTRALLQEVPRAYRTQLQEVLLAAVALTLADGSGGGGIRVDLEGHGREELFDDVDLSRTVGWFTAMYPVVLDPGDDGGPGAALQAIKEQLRRVPGKGLGYGLLRHVAADAETAARLAAPAALSFNYLGQLDQALPEGALFEPAAEPVGDAVHPARRREHALQIDAQILDDRLAVDWSYGAGRLDAATVEAWSQAFLGHLHRIVEHCLDPEAGRVTAEDFGLADLNDDDLMAALGQVGFGDP